MSVVAQFFWGAGGVLAGYVIIGLAAAVGKLIGGAVLRFHFDQFIFFMLRVSKKGRKISVGLCDPQPYISCSMTDSKDTKIRNLIYGSFSMAVALFFTETVCIQIWGTKIMPATAFTIPMAVVMCIYTGILVLYLGFSQKKKTESGAAGIMRREYERCYAAIKEGKSPGEIEMQRVAYSGKLTDLPIYKKYLLMLYYHFLDLGDYQNLGKVMDELEDHVPDKWSHGDMGILCEFVFYNVIVSPNDGKAKFYGKQFLDKLEGNEEANVKRVFAYWLFFKDNDKGAALQIAMEAIKATMTYRLNGCRRMEQRLIEALMKRIESTPS
ncbi:MAG: hypothetical protein NC293_03750 [Roseburia sp.]|nr:hypothetical protein [Roseburia sp.]